MFSENNIRGKRTKIREQTWVWLRQFRKMCRSMAHVERERIFKKNNKKAQREFDAPSIFPKLLFS